VRTLAIAGSLRADSLNRRLLEAAEGVGSSLGVELEILEPDVLRSLPHFDQELEGDPGGAVAELRRRIARADALLIATPEYNASVPGVLKNALDWASRPRAEAALQNKPAAVIGASPSPFGAVWAQADLRRILASSGARVSEHELAVGQAEQAFTDGGELAGPEQMEQLGRILAELNEQSRSDRDEPLAAVAA
jgi:chromate reductase